MAADRPTYRTETRRERQIKLTPKSKTIPLSICMVSFGIDANIALMIRAAACYGAESMMVIGSLPKRDFLNSRSGTTLDLMRIHQFSTPHDFLRYCRDESYHVVSAEICDGAFDLNYYKFGFDRKTVIVMGNEYTGVPAEVIHNSDCVYINHCGISPCHNVAQAGAIMANEYYRQYVTR